MFTRRRVRVPIWAKTSGLLAPVKPKRPLWKLIILAAAGFIVGGAAVVAQRLVWRDFVGHLGSLAGTNWAPPLLPSLLFVGIVVILLLWKLPALQVARSKALTDEKRFDRENEARKTLAQILAGVFVLVGLYSSVQTLSLSREGQITDRFTKAIEQLGALDGGKPKLEVRLGGIYALERIARHSERDHGAIMEVLTTYVREQSPYKQDEHEDHKDQKTARKKPSAAQPDEPRIRADIQAILTVLGRRQVSYDKEPLNLSKTDLGGADLNAANLNAAYLGGADLRGTDNLTQDQIDQTVCDDSTKLPPSLKKPKTSR